MDDDHDQIPNPEGQTGILESLRDRQRADQKRRHSRDEQELATRRHRRDTVGEPNVSPLHPKQDDENQEGLEQTFPGQRRVQTRRQLGQRKHKDKIEKQL